MSDEAAEKAWFEYKLKFNQTFPNNGGTVLGRSAFMAGRASRDAEVAALRERVAELEAVIAELKRLDECSSSPDWPGWNALESVWSIIRKAPSVVLADRDKAVRQVALRETADEYERRWGLDGVPEWLRELAEGDTNA